MEIWTSREEGGWWWWWGGNEVDQHLFMSPCCYVEQVQHRRQQYVCFVPARWARDFHLKVLASAVVSWATNWRRCDGELPQSEGLPEARHFARRLVIYDGIFQGVNYRGRVIASRNKGDAN